MAPAQPHHPLRRISTGSLSSLARSTDRATSSPSGLDFLQPALTELADEAATLAHNVQQMNELHDALGTFNESFAAYLYALKMNAFCVEWPQAPDENSFARLPKLSGELCHSSANRSAPPPKVAATIPDSPTPTSVPSQVASHQSHAGDLTYATAFSNATQDEIQPPAPVTRARGSGIARGRGRGANATAAAGQRKRREAQIAMLVDKLPLEYRGQDPVSLGSLWSLTNPQVASTAMEKVIMKLMTVPDGLSSKLTFRQY